VNSLERRVKAQETRLRPSGRAFLHVTPEEYDAMIRDACERVLVERADERTRSLIDAVLGAENWVSVQKEFHELNLPLRPANYSDWPSGTEFLFVIAPKVAASFDEWLESVKRPSEIEGG
jgi:hypothetical protein